MRNSKEKLAPISDHDLAVKNEGPNEVLFVFKIFYHSRFI